MRKCSKQHEHTHMSKFFLQVFFCGVLQAPVRQLGVQTLGTLVDTAARGCERDATSAPRGGAAAATLLTPLLQSVMQAGQAKDLQRTRPWNRRTGDASAGRELGVKRDAVKRRSAAGALGLRQLRASEGA